MMDTESRSGNLLRLLFDSIEEIVSILIAVRILYLQLTAPTSQSNEAILLQILIIVTLLAIGSLRDRLYRFRRIADTVTRIDASLGEKVFDPIRAGNFLGTAGDPHPSFVTDGNEVFISGITLVRTIGKLHEAIFDRVVDGADIKIMLLDSSATEAISQLKLRSWGTVQDGYYENRIAATSGQIDVIGENIRGISGASGSIELGLLPFVPSYGLLIVDPKDSLQGKAWIEIYHHRTDNPSPKFTIQRSRDSDWFEFFYEQFNEMWAMCNVRKVV